MQLWTLNLIGIRAIACRFFFLLFYSTFFFACGLFSIVTQRSLKVLSKAQNGGKYARSYRMQVHNFRVPHFKPSLATGQSAAALHCTALNFPMHLCE